MALRKIRSRYYVYFRDEDGRLRTRSLRTSDPDLARTLHADYMRSLQNRKARAVLLRDFPELTPRSARSPESSPIPEDSPRRRDPGIRVADMWECAAAKRPLSGRHRAEWRKFADGIGVRHASEVTPELAQRFLERRCPGGNGKTFNTLKSMLNTVFRCCLVEAGMTSSPFALIINRRVTSVESHRNLTGAEFDLVMKHIPVQLQILAMLSRWTAQRLETCARMTPEMLDFERRVFVIEPGKTRRFGKWVCCPVMPELEKFLRPILPECRPGVPLYRNFCSWSTHYASHVFNVALKKLGITDDERGKASFHSLRGTAITWFKEHGVKGEELRSITGHSSDAVEDVYARDIESISRIARGFSCM